MGAGIPSLSRLSWPEQPGRTDGAHFLDCGKKVMESRQGTLDSKIPSSPVSSAVLSNSAVVALIKKVPWKECLSLAKLREQRGSKRYTEKQT